MEPLFAIGASVVAGIFALGGAVVAWTLKNRSDAQERDRARSKERLEELKSLYTSILTHIEQLIRIVRARDPFVLEREMSEINAKVRLLASDDVAEKYFEVADLLGKWSRLHELASPRRMKVGGETVELVQAPDPTAQYKQPATDAHEEMQVAIERLINAMRAEVRGDA